MSQVVTTLTVDARGAEAGTALYVRQMKAAQAASDRVLDAERKAAEARERGTQTTLRASDSIMAINRRWQTLSASIDPAVRATVAIERAQLRADAAFRAGLATEAEAARIVDLVRQKHEAAAQAVNDNSAAQGTLVRSSGLARHELINLSRQAQDVVVSLSSGQDALTVLMQQGSQVADVFISSEATVGSFFRQLGGWLIRIAPLATVAATAITALYAAISVAGERRQLDTSLLGSGRSVGLTGGQYDQLAKASAESAQITLTNARLIAAEYARLGQLAATQLPQLTRLTKEYALVTGQGMTDAARELATAFADPSRGAEMLAGKVGALDSVTVRSIRTAEMYGDRLRAQKLLVDGLAQSMEGAAGAQSKWDRFVEQYFSRPVDRAKNAIADTVLGPETSERLAAIDRQLKDVRAAAASALPGPEALGINRALADLEQRKAALQQELKVTQDLAKARGDAADANRKIATAETSSREARPFGAELERLQTEASKLKTGYEEAEKAAEKLLLTKPADSPEWWAATKQAAELKVSYEALNRQLTEYKEAQAAGSIEADKAARAQEIQKRYLGQVSAESKAALAAELALNDARGTTKTATERQAEAERARTDAFIQTTRAQEEAKRASNDNIASLDAQARAVKTLGSEFAESAKLRKEAEQFAERNGGNAEEIYQKRLAERLAEVNKEMATRVAQTREAAAAEQAANSRGANISEAERAQLLQRQTTLMQERQRLAAAGMTDQAAVNAQIGELGRAIDRVNSAQAQAKALGMIYGQREQIAGLEQEIALIGASTSERNRLVAIMRAEQELRRSGIALTSAEGQEYVANAQKIAALVTVRDSLTEIRSIGSDALKGFLSDLRQGKSATEALTNALDRVADKLFDMATNQIMNGLFGSGGSGGGWFAKFFQSFFSSSGSGTPTDAGGTAGFWSARGNAFAYGNVIPFARGGAFTDQIVRHPTTFPFARGTGLMGEAGPEAVMPLRRDSQGRLGVAAAGGGAPQFNMQVVNNAGAEVKTEKRENDTGGLDIVMMIDQAVAESVSKPGSATNQALRTNFGARQQLTRR
ncbi:phage tail length tape measure family protein [Bosea sp. FBZP-16]|uniref:phage tail length tape measure family protein n=1 Tax=Bosea sp. FBZP-16 TaxID=2065382 RepID=UPI000C318FCA|nr:phage tail length tape measure family protein [Bosea sp. FBZP-16]